MYTTLNLHTAGLRHRLDPIHESKSSFHLYVTFFLSSILLIIFIFDSFASHSRNVDSQICLHLHREGVLISLRGEERTLMSEKMPLIMFFERKRSHIGCLGKPQVFVH